MLEIVPDRFTKVGRKLESCMRKAIYDFGLLDGVSHLSVALSGGKDSLTLLAMLARVNGKGCPPVKITGLHVGGAFSCGASIQRGWIEKMCASLKIELVVREETQAPTECYSCSRRRRTLLFAMAKEVGATHIAFGHHRDDNIETLLMNLLHKGEMGGMQPKVDMLNYGITIVRPLIYAEQSDIIAFAKQQGFYRITCQCPIGQHSMRRKTSELIDTLEHLFPNTRVNLSYAALKEAHRATA